MRSPDRSRAYSSGQFNSSSSRREELSSGQMRVQSSTGKSSRSKARSLGRNTEDASAKASQEKDREYSPIAAALSPSAPPPKSYGYYSLQASEDQRKGELRKPQDPESAVKIAYGPEPPAELVKNVEQKEEKANGAKDPNRAQGTHVDGSADGDTNSSSSYERKKSKRHKKSAGKKASKHVSSSRKKEKSRHSKGGKMVDYSESEEDHSERSDSSPYSSSSEEAKRKSRRRSRKAGSKRDHLSVTMNPDTSLQVKENKKNDKKRHESQEVREGLDVDASEKTGRTHHKQDAEDETGKAAERRPFDKPAEVRQQPQQAASEMLKAPPAAEGVSKASDRVDDTQRMKTERPDKDKNLPSRTGLERKAEGGEGSNLDPKNEVLKGAARDEDRSRVSNSEAQLEEEDQAGAMSEKNKIAFKLKKKQPPPAVAATVVEAFKAKPSARIGASAQNELLKLRLDAWKDNNLREDETAVTDQKAAAEESLGARGTSAKDNRKGVAAEDTGGKRSKQFYQQELATPVDRDLSSIRSVEERHVSEEKRSDKREAKMRQKLADKKKLEKQQEKRKASSSRPSRYDESQYSDDSGSRSASPGARPRSASVSESPGRERANLRSKPPANVFPPPPPPPPPLPAPSAPVPSGPPPLPPPSLPPPPPSSPPPPSPPPPPPPPSAPAAATAVAAAAAAAAAPSHAPPPVVKKASPFALDAPLPPPAPPLSASPSPSASSEQELSSPVQVKKERSRDRTALKSAGKKFVAEGKIKDVGSGKVRAAFDADFEQAYLAGASRKQKRGRSLPSEEEEEEMDEHKDADTRHPRKKRLGHVAIPGRREAEAGLKGKSMLLADPAEKPSKREKVREEPVSPDVKALLRRSRQRQEAPSPDPSGSAYSSSGSEGAGESDREWQGKLLAPLPPVRKGSTDSEESGESDKERQRKLQALPPARKGGSSRMQVSASDGSSETPSDGESDSDVPPSEYNQLAARRASRSEVEYAELEELQRMMRHRREEALLREALSNAHRDRQRKLKPREEEEVEEEEEEESELSAPSHLSMSASGSSSFEASSEEDEEAYFQRQQEVMKRKSRAGGSAAVAAMAPRHLQAREEKKGRSAREAAGREAARSAAKELGRRGRSKSAGKGYERSSEKKKLKGGKARRASSGGSKRWKEEEEEEEEDVISSSGYESEEEREEALLLHKRRREKAGEEKEREREREREKKKKKKRKGKEKERSRRKSRRSHRGSSSDDDDSDSESSSDEGDRGAEEEEENERDAAPAPVKFKSSKTNALHAKMAEEARKRELARRNVQLAAERLNSGEMQKAREEAKEMQRLYGTSDWRAQKKLRREKGQLERTVAAGKKLERLEAVEAARMDAFRVAMGLPSAEAQRQAEWRAEATRQLQEAEAGAAAAAQMRSASKKVKGPSIGPRRPR